MLGYEVAGRVGGLSGNEGELNVTTYENFPRTPNNEEPLFVMIDKLAVPLFVASFRRRSASAATILFDDIDTPARATELTGMDLFIRRSKKTAATEEVVGYAEMIGFSATVNGSLRGEVTDFIDHRMNPLLEITIDGEHLYAPIVDQFIENVDIGKRHICLSLPEGLAELYISPTTLETV